MSSMRFSIHPVIGIARLGSAEPSEDGCVVIGPEQPQPPGTTTTDPQKMRTKSGAVTRQGARFRIFQHRSDGSCREVQIGEEIDGIEIKRVEWTVHLANKKAFWHEFKGSHGERNPDRQPPLPAATLRNSKIKRNLRRKRLIIDAGPRAIKAPDDAAKPIRIKKSNKPAGQNWPCQAIQELGWLQVDEFGPLVVVGGRGRSASTKNPAAPLEDYANNDSWFDDTSDGSVRASIHLVDGHRIDVEPAWVIVAPPRFAPAARPVVTLYDAIFDTFVRQLRYRPDIFDPKDPKYKKGGEVKGFNPEYRPSFTQEIYPILYSAWQVSGLIAQPDELSTQLHHRWNFTELAKKEFAGGGFSPHTILQALRPPDRWDDKESADLMPRLHGDNDEGKSFLTLTHTQYYLMNQWAKGKFIPDWNGPPPAIPPEGLITADGLDRAALDDCIGGAFFPGIEAGWILRDPRVYVGGHDPFRIRVLRPGRENRDGLTPGEATMRSALPWQADFFDCTDGWWPSHRPDDVLTHRTRSTVRWASIMEAADDEEARRLAMVKRWSDLQFLDFEVIAGAPTFIETRSRPKRDRKRRR